MNDLSFSPQDRGGGSAFPSSLLAGITRLNRAIEAATAELEALLAEDRASLARTAAAIARLEREAR